MKDLIEETIKKIKKQGIKPDPRWMYLMKKYSMWFVFAVIIFLGAASFSIAFDMLIQLDWDLYRFAKQSALVYSLHLIPYLWLILIAIFVILAFFDIRKTEEGYKYNWLKISLISMGAILAVGALFSLLGLGVKFNANLTNGVPHYSTYMMTKEKQWMQPENGFLSGTLIYVSQNMLQINDLTGKKWYISIDQGTLFRPAAKIEKGEIIKIIGKKEDSDKFIASEIRPWMGRGMMGAAESEYQNMMRGGKFMMGK